MCLPISGVAWLGHVPDHWQPGPLGRMGRFFKGNGASKADEVTSGIPCVRYGDLYTRHEFFIRNTRSFVTNVRSVNYTALDYGDVLFAASGEIIDDIGRSAVNLIEGPACCGGDVVLFRPDRALMPEFLAYACDSSPSKWQKAQMGRGFTVVHIYASALKHLVIGIPPASEQKLIVRFLDSADKRIRRHIYAKQKLIKLLDEERQLIIHRAVAHGLDPNARLKPSGIKSLGDVPDHWQIKRAKYLFREIDERSTTGLEELLSVSHLAGVTPRSQKNVTMFKAASYVGQKTCCPGDLVINTMWAWMGALGISRYAGIVSSAYGVYRPLRESLLTIDYADLLLRARPYVTEYICRSTGIRSSRLRLYPEQFLRIPLCVPPIEEQRQLVHFVLSETKQLSATRTRCCALRRRDFSNRASRRSPISPKKDSKTSL